MKGKCLNQGGLSSWLQISSANHVVVCFVLNSEACIFLHRDYRKLLLVCFLSFFCFFSSQRNNSASVSIGAAMAVCSRCFVGSSSSVCCMCVYHIYWGAYRVHLIMGFFLFCFKIIRRMQQSFKTSAASALAESAGGNS